MEFVDKCQREQEASSPVTTGNQDFRTGGQDFKATLASVDEEQELKLDGQKAFCPLSKKALKSTQSAR